MKTAENEKGNIAVESQDIDKEVDVLVEELSSAPYEWTCKLSKPVLFGENTYEELHFNFGKLTAQDGIDIETELHRQTHIHRAGFRRQLFNACCGARL